MTSSVGPGPSRKYVLLAVVVWLASCQKVDHPKENQTPDSSVAAESGDSASPQSDTTPTAIENRFIVREVCEQDLQPFKIWVKMMTGKPVEQYIGCKMVLRNYQVRVWPGSDYVIIKADDRYGIPQMLLDYGESKSPKVVGSIRWNAPVVFMGVEEFPLQSGSTISAAVFMLEDGIVNAVHDWGGLLDIHNSRLDTLVGKSIDIADLATNPEIGDVIQRLLGNNSKEFFDRFELVQRVVQNNEFIVGEGCMSHQCSSDFAIYAIDMSTKRIAVAYGGNGRAYFYGENSNNPGAMCEPIRLWATTHGVEL